jgi:hypothetical protein
MTDDPHDTDAPCLHCEIVTTILKYLDKYEGEGDLGQYVMGKLAEAFADFVMNVDEGHRIDAIKLFMSVFTIRMHDHGSGIALDTYEPTQHKGTLQ